MPGKAIKIGPFDGGLNNVSLAGEATDKQLVDLVNFEVALDSSLQSRPAFITAPGSTVTSGTGIGQWNVLGIYRISSAQWYLIAAKPIAGDKYEINAYLAGDVSTSPVTIKTVTGSSNVPTGFAQMDTFAYFCMGPGSSISGFRWSNTVAAADITVMPKGNCMIAFKSRLWIAGSGSASSKLSFSTINTSGYHPELWDVADFINVAPGEGGFITCLLALNSYILIFKNDGTWRFSYPSKPASGQIDKISGSVGTANQDTVVEFENYIYVYDQGKVYELVNNNYTHINRFAAFSEDGLAGDSLAPGVAMSIVNRRIVIRYFNTIYSYSVDTRTWCQWRTNVGTPGKMYEMPADSSSTKASVYIAASCGTAKPDTTVPDSKLITFSDEYPNTSTVLEEMVCTMKTKAYDYQLASGYKRLYGWGIDMRTNQQMEATLIPVSKKAAPTWGDLQAYTHLELAQGTWGNPLSFVGKSLSIFDGGDPSNVQTENGRIYGKFTKSLRFRQVIFEVAMHSQGTMDSLAKVYSITSYVNPKEQVVAKFN